MIRVVPTKYLPAGRTGAIRFDTDLMREIATVEMLDNHSHMAVRPSVLLDLLDGYEMHHYGHCGGELNHAETEQS